LTANSAAPFRPDEISHFHMIGRISAVVLSQCPAAEQIEFAGLAKGHET
jgi:hypothetical protein